MSGRCVATDFTRTLEGSVSGYDVYGLVRAGDSGTSRHKFVGSLGHTSEDETGLIYMRARWMDPSLGRFISEDPARDGANWFEYSCSCPSSAFDPTGRFTVAEVTSALSSSFWAGMGGGSINALVALLASGGDMRQVATAFAGGFLGGALGVHGAAWSIAGAFASTFTSNMLNGAGFWNSFKRGLLSAGFAGAGTWMSLNAGEIRNAQLVYFMITLDADLVTDAGTASAGL